MLLPAEQFYNNNDSDNSNNSDNSDTDEDEASSEGELAKVAASSFHLRPIHPHRLIICLPATRS
jgi:hypothetical protein